MSLRFLFFADRACSGWSADNATVHAGPRERKQGIRRAVKLCGSSLALAHQAVELAVSDELDAPAWPWLCSRWWESVRGWCSCADALAVSFIDAWAHCCWSFHFIADICFLLLFLLLRSFRIFPPVSNGKRVIRAPPRNPTDRSTTPPLPRKRKRKSPHKRFCCCTSPRKDWRTESIGHLPGKKKARDHYPNLGRGLLKWRERDRNTHRKKNFETEAPL
ncbi:hypothetical protein B0J12DRAFT_30301 [Macrophomina phaseolina]|uniref:Uncharacterized protein n=1 Tax=Macrophomina phaseolina TaxID=35725 RepID=A0ABQ8GW19_9PEZI|nr:hypothetical protein B0J12DRAFT_30301 [Macrophomina phaseolina]